MVSRFIFSSILFLLILPLSCAWTMLNKLKNVFCTAVCIWLVIVHHSTFHVWLGLSNDIISSDVPARKEFMCGPSSFVLRQARLFSPVEIHHLSLLTRLQWSHHVSLLGKKSFKFYVFSLLQKISKNMLFLFMCISIDYYYAVLRCYIIIIHTVEGNHNSVTCLLDSDKLKPSPGLRSVSKIIIATVVPPLPRLRGD